MEAIPSPPETRARSRSKTPFTKGEENGKEGRKSPNLLVITEDLETTATPLTKSKRNTSQKASQSSSQSSSATTVIQTTTTSVTTRKSTGASTSNGNESALMSSSVPLITPPPAKKPVSKEMKDLENKRTKEIKQNEINEKIVKKTITSTPKMSPNTSSANFKLNSSHEDLDLEKHPAYKEYLEAGEYWNKYPKTDYTYSESSADRRDIGQGFVSMPNMSRKSLDRHVERVTTMIQNNPEQAAYLRQRYQVNPRTVSKTNKSFKLFSRSLLNYDSGDEVDLSEFDRRTVRRESVVRRAWVRVWTWITSIFTVFRRTTVTREQFRANYGAPRTSLWSRLQTAAKRSGVWLKESLVGCCKKIYLTLATILYLDTLLVRQRSLTETVAVEKGAGDATTAAAEEEEVVEAMPKNKRRFLWFLALLLPILLLAGWYWLCPLGSSAHASSAYGAAIIAERYARSVEAIKGLSVEVPPVGAYVREAGSKAGEKIVLMGTSALSAFGWLSWPSWNWNWTWIGGGGGSRDGATIKERMTVVHDWSHQADSSKMGDALREELKIYVDGLMGAKQQDILQTTNNYFFQLNAQHEVKIREIVEQTLAERQREFEKRSLSGEEVDNLMNLLLEKLRAGDYFKLALTEENFRKIFLDMRQRFLNDNDVFLDRLLDDPRLKVFVQRTSQGAVDMSSWDEKLEQLRLHLGALRGDLDGVAGSVEGARREMNRDADLEALKQTLMAYINQMIKEKVHEVVSLNLVNVQSEKAGSAGHSLANEDAVRRLIVGALKVYDADKTGLSDYALESAGGQVLSTRCTENYHTKSAQISVFGIPLWYPSNTPRTAIQPNVLPGNCWAFQGFPGFLVLQLNMEIFVTGFTMEHIPKSLSNDRIDSAPKRFSVWGLANENDQEPANFGYYEYSDADDAPSYQHFEVQATGVDRKYQIVELRIESNHGHPNYTCLYRFRVHGSPI